MRRGEGLYKKKRYKVYGLSIDSEIEFEEMISLEQEETADVSICYGKMPSFIKEKKAQGYRYSIKGLEYYWLLFDEVGEFYIQNGNQITVEVYPNAKPHYVRAVILGTAMGLLMLQRGVIAIHGGAVIMKDRAVVISGNSGAGKSTLVTQLREQKYKMLADDTVALTLTKDMVYANAAYPQQKLCKDTAFAFDYRLEDLIYIDENKGKYALRLTDEFQDGRIQLGIICVLRVYDGEEVIIKELQGHKKLETFLNNLYSYVTYKEIGMPAEQFQDCLKIIQSIPIYEIHRPRGKQTTTEQIALLERKIMAWES